MSNNASKRKAADDGGGSDSDDSSSSYDPSVINVDFDFQAPSEIDFQAIKRLLQQLFYTHAASGDIDLSVLAQHVLDMAASAEASLGTVIKVEGDEDMDPFAFISAVDLSKATSSAAGRELSKYFQARLASSSSLPQSKAMQDLFTSASARPLLVLHERMINLPPATAPPLYRMVMDEVAQAKDLSEYTHLVFFSRVFSSDAFSDDDDDDGGEGEEENGRDRARGEGAGGKRSTGATRAKRRKAQAKQAIKNETIAKGAVGTEDEEMGLFHPEDALIARRAAHTHTFRFPPPKDAAKDFEAPMFGRIAVVARARDNNMAQLIEEMQAAFEGTAPMAVE